MSTTPRPPLLRDKSIESMARNSSDAIVSATIMDSNFDDRASEAFRTGEEVGRNVRRFYEAARAKDAELIQRLVDAGNAMRDAISWHMDEHVWEKRIPYGTELNMYKAADAWGAAAGFKPSEP